MSQRAASAASTTTAYMISNLFPGDEQDQEYKNEASESISELPPASALSRRSRILSGPRTRTDNLSYGQNRGNLPTGYDERQESAVSRSFPQPDTGINPDLDKERSALASRSGVFSLDREKSAGRESLVSRGAIADGNGRINRRDSAAPTQSVNFIGISEEPSGESGRLESSSTYGPRPPTTGGPMERLPTRAGMSSASGQRPFSGRMILGGVDNSTLQSRAGGRQTSEGTPMSRPTTSGRMMTARPVTAALKGAPTTATRLLSAVSVARPGTRTGLATGLGVNTPISVVDRPITQQGLTGMKTGSRGPQRQVQDASYFMGLLRAKMTEIGGELTKMNEEIRTMKQEQSTFLTYDKRVKETAQEISEQQGSLADYNLLVDLMNTDTEKLEIDEESKELQQQNEEDTAKVDSMFSEKQEFEQIVRSLESQLDDERHIGETVFESMDSQSKQKYIALRDENRYMQEEQERMQQQIDILNQKKQSLEEDMSISRVKQEALTLSERLQEIQEKRDELVQEKMQRGTPKEERERLLLQVKDDNGEISTMERQITDITERINRIQSELQDMDQEIDENQSERSQKYRELKKREETMEQFMANFEQSRMEEIQRLDQLEEANVDLLEKLSRNMMHMGGLPNVAEYDALRGDLAFKEGELEKSRYTVQSLQQEHVNLQANLQKIEALESKVQRELIDVKEKIRRMEGELEEFSDIDGLRTRSEEKRQELTVQKGELEAKKTTLNFTSKEIEVELKMLQKQLKENETHGQLMNLEKKWSTLEQNNFTLLEFVAQKKAESDYIPIKKQAMKIVVDYNKVLQEVIASGGIIA